MIHRRQLGLALAALFATPAVVAGVSAGAMTLNERRRLLGLPPVEPWVGEDGSEFIVPADSVRRLETMIVDLRRDMPRLAVAAVRDARQRNNLR